VLPHLGWRTVATALPVAAFTVRTGTQLLLGCTPLPAERTENFTAFCRAALGPTASLSSVQLALARLPTLFAQLWRLRWDNSVKEVFWRLVYDGLPTAARQHRPFSCACDSFSPDRLHHFWDCPVAKAVVSILVDRLPRVSVLPRSAVWLCLAPAGQHEEAWAAVSLCALAAMERGRREMYRRLCEGQAPSPAFVTSLQRHAIARFWELLADFCAVGAPRPAWRESIGTSHPFLSFHSNTNSWHVKH